MGLISDYYEKALERELGLPPWVQERYEPIRVPRFACEFCGSRLESDAERQDHVFKRHAHETFYLRVDDEIALGEVLLRGVPHEVELVMQPGELPVEVQVTLGGAPLPKVSYSNTTTADLGSLLSEFDGAIVLVRRGALSRTYRFRVMNDETVAVGELDDLVLEAQAPLLDGALANWETLRDRAEMIGSSAARVYLTGFAAYLQATVLERSLHWTAARRRWEEAFSALRRFPRGLARDAAAVVAFRFNAWASLKERGPKSTFWAAANFFDHPDLAVMPQERPRQPARGVWIDDFQEGLLRAVDAFLRSDLQTVRSEIDRLPADLGSAVGNGPKRDLIEARLAGRVGDVRARHAAYLRLLDEPAFAAEAARFA